MYTYVCHRLWPFRRTKMDVAPCLYLARLTSLIMSHVTWCASCHVGFVVVSVPTTTENVLSVQYGIGRIIQEAVLSRRCLSVVQQYSTTSASLIFFIISYFSFRFTTHSLTHQSTFLDEGWRQQTTTPISFFSIVLDLVTPPLDLPSDLPNNAYK